MNNQQSIINVIIRTLPNLHHKVEEGNYHSVGYWYENNNGSKAFVIQGSGFSELEAWQDAYHWVNKLGPYRSTDELKMF